MEPENLRFGGEGGAPVTLVAVFLMLIAGILMLVVSKKNIIYPFFFGAFLIPFKQAFTIGGAHIQMLRFLAMFGLLRMFFDGFVTRKEKPVIGILHPIDKAFIWFTICSACAFILLNRQFSAFTNQLGGFFNSFGIYFLLRYLVKDQEDVGRALKALTLIVTIIALAMMIEHQTATNLFGYLGGVSLTPEMREGRVRSEGPFSHPLIAGCVGAILVPLSFWFWLRGGKERKYGLLCFVSSTIMTLTSGSSTSVLAYVAGISAFVLWPFRRRMRWIRWGTVVMLMALHLVMHGPVWSLIAHIDIVGGSSADHRYQLVNQCINHFWDWWLIGTNNNDSWGWGLWDTSNTYVQTAITGGLLSLILFLTIITRSFRSIGEARAKVEPDKHQQLLLWCIGSALFAQCVGYFGITYFDQSIVAWYILLVITIALTGTQSFAGALASESPQTLGIGGWQEGESWASSEKSKPLIDSTGNLRSRIS